VLRGKQGLGGADVTGDGMTLKADLLADGSVAVALTEEVPDAGLDRELGREGCRGSGARRVESEHGGVLSGGVILAPWNDGHQARRLYQSVYG
jgi:hypothetical protein